MGVSQQARAVDAHSRHWRATVERQAGPCVRWTPRVERVGELSERYEGPTVDDPIQGRTWCLTKIAELRG